MKDYSLIIIIPVYNTNPKKTELASLQQFSKVYNWKYDVRIICPDDFSDEEVVDYITLLNAPENVYVQYKRYDSKYFKTTESYSQLLKLNSFYNDYADYDYMLILQTDVWTLSLDNIDEWINKGFDYIGAPILTNKQHWPSSPCCGNGGLSLRKISSFIKYTSNKEIIDILNKNDVYNKYEDVFFCEGISQYMYIDMPTWQECAEFAWDMNPDILWDYTGGEFPHIGIHAWPKNMPFWKDKIDVSNEVVEEAIKDNLDFINIYYKH